MKQSISEVKWPTKILAPLAVTHKVSLTLQTFSELYPCQSWRKEKALKNINTVWLGFSLVLNLMPLVQTTESRISTRLQDFRLAWSTVMWNCNSWQVEYWKKLTTSDRPEEEENHYYWQLCFSSVQALAFSTVFCASVLLSVNNLKLSQHNLISYYQFPATPVPFSCTEC